MYHPCLLLISMLFASSQADPDPDAHLHLHLPPEDGGQPGKAPKIGAGVLNQREGASGQQEAGPTQGTLTTVPSINEMANGNPETSPIKTNCGGHVSYQGCSGCPNGAPKDRWTYCNGVCKWVFKSWPGNDGECVYKNSKTGIDSVNCGGHRAPACGLCYGPRNTGAAFLKRAQSVCNGDCKWTCTSQQISSKITSTGAISGASCSHYDCRSKTHPSRPGGDYFNQPNVPANEIGSHPPPPGGDYRYPNGQDASGADYRYPNGQGWMDRDGWTGMDADYIIAAGHARRRGRGRGSSGADYRYPNGQGATGADYGVDIIYNWPGNS